ncbi:hypothetical protein [Rhodohalobacter sp. SW132]|uniref:hypothetical protein n=1 Tax=Rhodohalobacter sp. SW132 TaxID=2293433 RepID=UPI0013150893|nr:hypothetical protein [Rhodohalobacter sp. SW132]
MNFQIEIEPESEATVEQHLDFGMIETNSGHHHIGFDSSRAGVFRINTYQASQILLTLESSNVLKHAHNASDNRINLSLNAFYRDGENYNESAQPIREGIEQIELSNREYSSGEQEYWSALWIIIGGSIDVDDILPGLYTGKATLTIYYE